MFCLQFVKTLQIIKIYKSTLYLIRLRAKSVSSFIIYECIIEIINNDFFIRPNCNQFSGQNGGIQIHTWYSDENFTKFATKNM